MGLVALHGRLQSAGLPGAEPKADDSTNPLDMIGHVDCNV